MIDVTDPGLVRRLATFPVPGEIADSRMVGDVLYLVTHENAACYRCGPAQRTLVTTFDLSSPAAMRQVDQVAFDAGPAGSWGPSDWKRSVTITAERMYLGGHADLARTREEGVIDVLDIADPTGKLGKGAHLTTRGAILSRWQMDEHEGVLRVISQEGVGYTRNGAGAPKVQTFHIWNTGSMQLMADVPIQLPRQEALKTVRFDGPRAYAITFAETDPLFVIDLANEAAPRQRGEIHMPGWVFHLEPRGARVLGLGLDRTDPAGHLNVSLFDVADMDRPRMLQRVAFGATGRTTDQSITSYELPEDQDRIQKAFRVLEGGLVVVPFSGAPAASSGAGVCVARGGVQLIDWSQDTLERRAVLPVAGSPRRALLNPGTRELLAVSDSNVTAFDVAERSFTRQTADLSLGVASCDVRTLSPRTPMGSGAPQAFDRHGDDVAFYCSVQAPSSMSPRWTAALLGILAILGAARRRRPA